jgi:hypothetical protein
MGILAATRHQSSLPTGRRPRPVLLIEDEPGEADRDSWASIISPPVAAASGSRTGPVPIRSVQTTSQ